MAAGNYITAKVQRALVAFLQAQAFASIPAENIYKGIENPTRRENEPQELVRATPCIICLCQSASPEVREGITWDATASVIIRTNADDTTEEEHHDIAAAVLDLLTTDTIAADLSAAIADFHAHYISPGPQSWRLRRRSFESLLGLQILCCGRAIG